MLNIAEMSGSITGAGKLTKIGEGQLVLSGDNTYSGGTSIEQGRCKLVAVTV
ncbi:hypothetical protein HGG76_20720 [Ochrobactrum tritici]|uniref:Outer membrane autotransporter n=1 Tax=Brucella tritici TaxID=94626 RepID=A0A7X6FRP3_9HYPH|nr:hypothetical protein [Brucella tritici]